MNEQNDNYTELVRFLYERAQEVQPHLQQLAQDLKACGLSDRDVAIELSFAMLHEGYRLKCVTEEAKLIAHERKLQTHIPEESEL